MILVTGGAGYLGSQFVRELSQTSQAAVVIDNLSRGQIFIPLNNIENIQGDFADISLLSKIFAKYKITSIVHLASSPSVRESTANKQAYFVNNVEKTKILIDFAIKSGTKQFIFASSCSVYGTPKVNPAAEGQMLLPSSPYGQNKLDCENYINDCGQKWDDFRFANLRFFNIAGHVFPKDKTTTLARESFIFPQIMQALKNKTSEIEVYGSDLPTDDGSPIRDYIHVSDVIFSILKCLNYLKNNNSVTLNIGTGLGTSVKELIYQVETTSKQKIKTKSLPNISSESQAIVADNKLALNKIGWRPMFNLNDIIKSEIERYF